VQAGSTTPWPATWSGLTSDTALKKKVLSSKNKKKKKKEKEKENSP